MFVFVILNMKNSEFLGFPNNAVEVAYIVIVPNNKINGAGENSLIIFDDVVASFLVNPRSGFDMTLPDLRFLTVGIFMKVRPLYHDTFIQ